MTRHAYVETNGEYQHHVWVDSRWEFVKELLKGIIFDPYMGPFKDFWSKRVTILHRTYPWKRWIR